MKTISSRFKTTAICAAIAGAGMGAVATPALGQNATIEELIVTSRKRQENVQDIPVAITALGEATIDNLGATSVSDLVTNVPNLAMDPNGNSLNSWGLRGIVSVSRNAGQESGLGVYIDGVYAGRPASFNFPLSDIQQVEVLRGPQGSLFGRNTIAGAINITTKMPYDEFQGQIKTTLGNYSKVNVEAGVSGAIVEGTLNGKISGFSFQRDGYVKNISDGKDQMSEDRVGGRMGLYWTPNDRTEIIFSGDYLEQDNRQIFGATREPGLNDIAAGWYQSSAHKINSNDPNSEKIKSGGSSLTVNFETESEFILSSITAKRFADFELLADDDAGPLTLTYSEFQDDSDTFSQEFKIVSPSYDSYDYVAGLYYLNQSIEAARVTSVLPYPENTIGILSESEVDTKAWAAFGTLNVYPTEDLTLTLGLRYTDEDKSSQFSQLENAGIGFPTVSFSPDISDQSWSGDVSASYAIDENIKVYSSIRRGTKSGGFQTDVIDFTSPELFEFGAETATSYELGLKGSFFERSMEVNASIFRTDYEDMQVGQLLGLGFTTTNAGESEINGIELELRWVATDNLSFGFSAGVLDHEYTSYDDCNGVGVDCDGNKLQLVSDWTAAANMDYWYPLNSGAVLELHVDGSTKDDSYTDAVNDKDLLVEGLTLVNARIGYVSADESYSVYLWGKNLADKESDSVLWKYPITGLFFGSEFSGLQGIPSMPRTYGIEATYRF
ncbi:TonB-dependent receptor [Dasania marina]|uniref:TonB-dependent receptor n=1 Tax=Dasania marina TaxID=471499 RepID=UPI0030DBBD97|tara:strand:- start:3362 stop:5533 length:2172 start_codon:yes stop_codon:yes gene_type:complete